MHEPGPEGSGQERPIPNSLSVGPPTSNQEPAPVKSVLWHVIPVMAAWLATTWTRYDLLLAMLAASLFLWDRSSHRARPTVVTPATWQFVLGAGLVAIAFDVLVGRLVLVDADAGRTVRVGGALIVGLTWFLLRARAYRSAIGALLLFSLLAGSIFITRVDEPGIDVWRAHEGAAGVLVDGGNPYTDLDLTLEPGSTEGRRRQYFYPPVTLVWYSGWTFLLGDPRWGSLIAWLVLLMIGSAAALRSAHPSLGLALVTFAGIQPGWFFLLAGSFTEPLIVMLIATSMAAVNSRPRLSAGILGLALASKQHLLLAAPLVVLSPWRSARIYAVLAGATTVLAFAIGFLFGPGEYLAAVILGPTLAEPNAEAINLYALGRMFGLELRWPQWVAVVVATLVGLLVSIRPRSSSWPSGNMAAVFAAFLLLVPFAIWSHWMIVTLLLSISVFVECLAPNDRRTDEAASANIPQELP